MTTVQSSTIVGALACQKDSFLRSLETQVVSCKKFTPKKNEPSGLYQVELVDTCLFPEGGGQFSDKGYMTTSGGQIEVQAVIRDKLKALHIIDTPLDTGSQVKLDIDWDKRVDYMQQHTGQHLLSAVFDQYKLETLSWKMGDQINYIELPEKIDDKLVEEVQAKVNQLIFESHPISVSTDDTEQDTSHIPEDYDQEQGIVRIVKIGDIDANPCCGTHLKNTSQILSIVLLNQTSVRGGHSRLFFTCGYRVSKLASNYFNILKNVSGNQLSCQIEDVTNKVDLLSTNYKKANSTIANLTKELANLKATEIYNKFLADENAIAYVYREENNPDFLTSVQKELMTMDKTKAVDLDGKQTLVLICGNQQSNGGMIKISGPKATDISNELKQRITNLKGGGKGSKYQGKITKYEKNEIDSVLLYLESL
ncbi:uncharacterized protein KGF55_004071 [Candida pseudojiufengensis]|uniref:uncharacterized protein n=1 Tax=Candida pseudojiufengensis TaxID=497109 RepID=UPI00222449C8|nr:uncharacterized protein KGF55_004071 [Candida pseudojiufengensis]KAI5961448.1 hypothetical protein KGF55_004071 [Candida pseudojiufengensis]